MGLITVHSLPPLFLSLLLLPASTQTSHTLLLTTHDISASTEWHFDNMQQIYMGQETIYCLERFLMVLNVLTWSVTLLLSQRDMKPSALLNAKWPSSADHIIWKLLSFTQLHLHVYMCTSACWHHYYYLWVHGEFRIIGFQELSCVHYCCGHRRVAGINQTSSDSAFKSTV